jgi:hypothetical protein
MDLVLYAIIGAAAGCLVLVGIMRLFSPSPTVEVEELIKESEERLEGLKRHGEELDRMLEESKK